MYLRALIQTGLQQQIEEEVGVRSGADLDGKTLVECNLNRRVGVNVLALRRRGKESVESGPISDMRLEPGDVLVALGTREQLEALRQVA